MKKHIEFWAYYCIALATFLIAVSCNHNVPTPSPQPETTGNAHF